jgi:hypothetical protein
METVTYNFEEIRVIGPYAAVAVPVATSFEAGQVLSYNSDTGLYYARHVHDESDSDDPATSAAVGIAFHGVDASDGSTVMCPMLVAGVVRRDALTGYVAGDLPAVVVLGEAEE